MIQLTCGPDLGHMYKPRSAFEQITCWCIFGLCVKHRKASRTAVFRTSGSPAITMIKKRYPSANFSLPRNLSVYFFPLDMHEAFSSLPMQGVSALVVLTSMPDEKSP